MVVAAPLRLKILLPEKRSVVVAVPSRLKILLPEKRCVVVAAPSTLKIVCVYLPSPTRNRPGSGKTRPLIYDLANHTDDVSAAVAGPMGELNEMAIWIRETALHLACVQKQKVHVTQELLRCRANVNKKDEEDVMAKPPPLRKRMRKKTSAQSPTSS